MNYWPTLSSFTSYPATRSTSVCSIQQLHAVAQISYLQSPIKVSPKQSESGVGKMSSHVHNESGCLDRDHMTRGGWQLLLWMAINLNKVRMRGFRGTD